MNRSTVYIKTIDYLLGPSLLKVCAALNRKRVSSLTVNKPGRILIIRPGGIGDAALLLPSIKNLSRLFPEAKIDVLCEGRNRGIFLHSPWVDELFNYRDCKDLLHVVRNSYDLVFDTEQSHFLSTVLVSVLRSSLSVGFATMGREGIYDIAVPYFHDDYEMRSFFKLFGRVIEGWEKEESWNLPYLIPTTEEREKINILVGNTRRPLVCIFPGASIEERLWPTDRWSKVTRNLFDKGSQPLLLGGETEKGLCEKIAIGAEGFAINLCGKLSLKETASLFERSSLLISTDSGILHLGVICGIRTVSLFGPGIAEKWAPKGGRHIVINKKVDCSPCTRFGETPLCPHGIKCLKEITVEDVSNAALKLLAALDCN